MSPEAIPPVPPASEPRDARPAAPTVIDINKQEEAKPPIPAKAKTTLSLKSLGKPNGKNESESLPIPNAPLLNEPVTAAELERVWQEFTTQRKSQPAEFQLLSRGYRWDGQNLHVELTNPVEEMLLETLRTDLLGWLREQLRNQHLNLQVTLKANEDKKVVYTNREKFDFLVQQYPPLRELKEKLGLDPDF